MKAAVCYEFGQPLVIEEVELDPPQRGEVDIPRLAAEYQRGNLKLDELISQHYPLKRINEALQALERGEALHNVIVF